MRLSRYFMPTLREAPSDAQVVSHQLMLRAGMIRQEAAGVYAWLLLGLRVLKKVEQMIQEIPEVIECDKVTGEDCFIVRLVAHSMEQLDQILDRLAERAQSNTSISSGFTPVFFFCLLTACIPI